MRVTAKGNFRCNGVIAVTGQVLTEDEWNRIGDLGDQLAVKGLISVDPDTEGPAVTEDEPIQDEPEEKPKKKRGKKAK